MNLSAGPGAASGALRSTRAVLWVALQSAVEVAELARFVGEGRIARWLYLGEDSAWRVRAERAIGPGAPRVSIAGRLDRVSRELRQPYIDWIGELSRRNDSLEWWSSGLAEKNPFGRFFIRVCMLASAWQIIADGWDGPTLMVCSSPAMMDQLLAAAEDSDVIARSVVLPARRGGLTDAADSVRRCLRGPYRRMRNWNDRLKGRAAVGLDGDPAHRRTVLARHGVEPVGGFSGDDAVLAVIWVDARNFDSTGAFRDPYLGELPGILRDRGYRVAYVPRVLPSMQFDEAVARLAGCGERTFFPEQLVDLEEVESCRERAGSYRPSVPPDARIGGVPVHGLAMEQADHDRARLVDGLSIERMVAGLSAWDVRPRQIIHPWEGHAWEQALAWSVRRHMPGTSVVGYDLGIFSPMVLSMYPSKSELGLRPLPDRVVTSGPLAQETLSTDGLPPELVRSGCAMRFPGLAAKPSEEGGEVVRPGGGPTRILVAPSLVFSDSVDLVDKACIAFGGNPDVELLVKCHPNVSTRDVIRALGPVAKLGNVRFSDLFLVSDLSPGELMSTVDIVLYTYTTVCFDALRSGAIPVFVRPENGLNLDKLEAAPEVRWVAASPDDLRRVVADVMAMSDVDRAAWRERGDEVRLRAFAPVKPDCVDAFIV